MKQKTCNNGHLFYKSSDCSTCPICEKEKRPQDGFLSLLSAPARRSFQNEGIDSLIKVSQKSIKEILALHGVGNATIPTLEKPMKEVGLTFKN
jgi:hypothetical protein